MATLRTCPGRERTLITRFCDELADNPFRAGGDVERDEIGRPIQVLIVGRHAVCFWADHAVKEVKVLGMKLSGS